MKGFPGFPDGKQQATRIPSRFFSELLPAMDHLAELKVTLHCFWLSGRRSDLPPFVRRSELSDDSAFLMGLADGEHTGEQALQDGLERAVARGTLIRVTTRTGERSEDWYFLNTERGRAAVRSIQHGDWSSLGQNAPEIVSVLVERPNIFVLYEQNIGLLQPMIADELRDAERQYPGEWIEDAFREAARLNRRSWRYVQRILERWAAEGREGKEDRDGKHREGSAEDRQRYISGEYGRYIEH